MTWRTQSVFLLYPHVLVFSLVSVCCNAFLFFQFAVVFFLSSVCDDAFLLSQFVVAPDLVSNGRSPLLIDAKLPVFTVQYPYSSNRFLLRYLEKIQADRYVSMMTSMQLPHVCEHYVRVARNSTH